MTRTDVHLRVMVADDAPWVVAADQQAGEYARSQGWEEPGKLAAELDEGSWASDVRWAWVVIAGGDPIGFALVRGLTGPDAEIEVRISPDERGRGAGREVLRQLAEHHFAESDRVTRLVGRAHELNVPMQRAFAAAGFRMEARFRDSYLHSDGSRAAEWGYALTRADWRAGRHRSDDGGFDLHGLSFVVTESSGDAEGAWVGTVVKFLQEGRRALARYDGPAAMGGELAGILLGDVLAYRFAHDSTDPDVTSVQRGHGRMRVQRRHDGRLEGVDEWTRDHGETDGRYLVEKR